MHTLQIKKSLILTFILLSHLFSVFTPANASMQKLHNINQNEDLAPICNGTGKIRWVKLSDYYETGKLIFVELPSSKNDTSQKYQVKCSVCSAFTALDDDVEQSVLQIFSLDFTPHNIEISHSKNYFKQAVASANSRAPPKST